MGPDDDEPPLFHLEPSTHARGSDPDTSHAAARRLTQKRTMMRNLLEGFWVCRMTASQAATFCDYTAEDGAWKRVSDLATAGLICDTGERKPGPTGRSQIVWQITQKGKEALGYA